MPKSVGEKKLLRNSTDVPSHSGKSSYSQQSYKVVEDMESERSRSSSPIVDDSGYDSLCNEPNDPFNISSQQNSEDADKSKYKPDKKNSEPSKSVNQLEPSYHVSSSVFYYGKFNDHGLGNDESPLRKKFNSIIKDLKEKGGTHQGSIKLISSKGGVKYLRAKLSDKDRLLFTQVKHNNEDVFVMLEVIPNHDYGKSDFLGSKDKTRNIEVEEMKVTEKGVFSDNASTIEIKDLQRAHWLGKLLTFSAKQEEIVESKHLPLVVSGAAGSGKTSVALESLGKMKEKFEGGKILYITKSKNLVKESKKLLEYEHYDKTTGKLKTCVPEEIEFLSVHELFEKLTGDIKGKKPINRDAFFLWFNEICKKKDFCERKKDGDKILEEFVAVIAGRSLTKEKYKELGNRQAVFPQGGERGKIYALFEEYKKFIKENSEYYDTSIITHQIQANKVYDAVVVDEVQDLTESVLDLILKSLKDESKSSFLLCGDVNQVIHPSFFSKSRLKFFLSQNGYLKKNESEIFYTLEKNYRNSEQVIELANRILHFKNYCFASEDKMTEKEKELFFMKSETGNTGNVGFIAKDKEQEIAEKVPGSINWAVLVLDDESKEDARKLFGTPLVFSIQEAKGLEFKNVILYKFTSHEAYNKIWNVACSGKGKEKNESTIDEIRELYKAKDINTSRPKGKESKFLEEHKFYMNALYVGITRAIDNVYIIDDEKRRNLLKVIKPEKEGHVSIENIKKEESSPEEWRDMALKLIDEGNIEQAENIAKELLCKGEKEYGKEIMHALEDKGYHIETPQKINDKLQSSLDKDKLEQPMESFSELKIDTESSSSSQSPQRSSQGKSESITRSSNRKKGKKHTAKQDQNKAQWDRNKDQEKKPKKLKQNKKLFNIISKNKVEEFKTMDISQYDEQEILNLALKSFSLKIANYLIEDKGVTLKNSDSFIFGCTVEDYTVLHIAVQENCRGIVKFLLQHGAKVDAKDSKGFTPLHVAVGKGYGNIVQLLLQEGADVNARAEGSITPLYVAAAKDYKDIVKLLLEHGADVNAKDSESFTSLHMAVKHGHDGIVDLLLKHKDVDLNAKGSDDYTPLHMAAVNGNKDVVKLLLEHGADVNAKDRGDYTPLHMAAANGNKDVVELLLQKGADVNAKATQEGSTPLALAVKYKKFEMFDPLLADPNINLGCLSDEFVKEKVKSIDKKEHQKKILQKLDQDGELFNLVKQAAKAVDKNKVGELLGKIEKLLALKNEDGLKLGLNYFPSGNYKNTTIEDDRNTTVEIAIKSGGKVLHLLYDYAEKNIGTDTEIFKLLKDAKENSPPKSDFNNASTSHHFTQAKDFSLDGI